MCWCWPSVSLIHGIGEWDGAVAPESLSKQLCGTPMGTVGDMIQMRPATICLMADRYKAEREGRRDEEGGRQHAGQMKGWVSHLKKAQRQILHLSFCVICLHRLVTLKLMYCIRPTNSKCLQTILFKNSRSSWCCMFKCTVEADALPQLPASKFLQNPAHQHKLAMDG